MPQTQLINYYLKQPVILTLAVLVIIAWHGAPARAACSTPAFRTAPSYSVGSTQPRSIAVGDFNSDGKPDLATANHTANNVSILLNLGGGVYGAPNIYPAGDGPMFVVTGDFNSDGKLDLAIANRNTNDVSILQGNGDGSFGAPANYAVGSEPSAIALGDFNSDTKLDLAISNSTSTFVSILLGTGAGTFTAGANVPVIGSEGGNPFSIVAGDLNNDGKQDLLVAEYNSTTSEVAILPGVGNGTFGPKVSLTGVGSAYSVAVADFNADGKLDIVTADLRNNGAQTGFLFIIFGNGTYNTSGSKTQYNLVGGDPIRIAIGDFNNDGRPDVATANFGAMQLNTVSLFLHTNMVGGINNQEDVFYVVSGTTPIAVVAADLNGDSKTDLVSADYNTSNLSVFLNPGAGNFPAPVPFFVNPPSFDTNLKAILTADVNSDGKQDILTVSGAVAVSLGDGAGGFGAATNAGVSVRPNDAGQRPVALADFNNDGKVDIAALDPGSNFQLEALLGNGNGTFGSRKQLIVGTFAQYLVAGDFNNDGKQDIAAVSNSTPNTITIFLGAGTGSFTFASNNNLGAGGSFIITKDFNSDGKLDLAAVTSGSNPGINILLGNGAGAFTQTPPLVAAGTVPFYLASADFNLDGKQDLAALYPAPTNSISVFLGAGNGSFGPAINFPTEANPQTLTVADFNRDGIPDLITANQGSNDVSIFQGNGMGGFNLPLSVYVLGSPNAAAVGDFNNDGAPDFATAHSIPFSGGLVTPVLNACPGGAQVADFDGDAQTDISVWNPTNGNWYIFNSRDNSFRTQTDWGRQSLGDFLVPGDYDGDTKTDIAIFRQSEGNWYIIQSATNSIRLQNWGGPGDRPARADFDGDGKCDFAVFRPSEGNWYILLSATGTTRVQGWGLSSDKLVPADYDGDGKADIAVWRPSEGNWYIIKSGGGGIIQQQWGISGDVPVPGNYDGDTKTDIAVWRPSEGNWYIIKSSTNSIMIRNWGDSTDIPIPGDYDKDGKTDVAVYRPSQGNWYITPSSTNAPYFRTLGVGNEVPIPSTYIPYQPPLGRPQAQGRR
ncbi:MAG TPA: VCBS repeat-containing protein [Pyrinomonadaceae bacterium]